MKPIEMMTTSSADPPASWWHVLPAIPPTRDSAAYTRLKRVWFDHTWSNHPFLNPAHENHLVATLFENFSVLPPVGWLPRLIETAGIPSTDFPTAHVSWAYEILDKKSGKLADMALHTRGPEGEAVLVIEAKAKGGILKPSDSDPGSYLDLEEFAWCPRRHLIYLVDETDRGSVAARVRDDQHRSGLLSWQQLGSIQIRAASELPCDQAIRHFVSGAIQYQFLQHGITPADLCAEYLHSEPTRDEIHSANPDKMTDFTTIWRLPEP